MSQIHIHLAGARGQAGMTIGLEVDTLEVRGGDCLATVKHSRRGAFARGLAFVAKEARPITMRIPARVARRLRATGARLRLVV